jgi:hypothetical protein
VISAFLPGEEEQQIEHYRHMPPEAKFEEIASLNRLQTERQRADIRARYGDIPAGEMRMRLGALRLGRETMVKAFGWDPGETDGFTAQQSPS